MPIPQRAFSLSTRAIPDLAHALSTLTWLAFSDAERRRALPGRRAARPLGDARRAGRRRAPRSVRRSAVPRDEHGAAAGAVLPLRALDLPRCRALIRRPEQRARTRAQGGAAARRGAAGQRRRAGLGGRREDRRARLWPLLLDGVDGTWRAQRDLASHWSGDDPRAAQDDSGWSDHVEPARSAAQGAGSTARRPARRPARSRRRSSARRTRERGAAIPQRPTALDAADTAARLPAAQIAWALRGLFNGPEATTLLRVGKPPFSATRTRPARLARQLQPHRRRLHERDLHDRAVAHGVRDALRRRGGRRRPGHRR